MITAEILLAGVNLPGSRVDALLPWLNTAAEEFEIDSPLRAAHWLAQCAHESAGMTTFSENLNYSADALRRVFPRYFDGEFFSKSIEYARQPERIANRIYANRMGNGDEASGDGWRHRGAGLIQTTGKANHARVSEHFGIPLEQLGDWLRTPEGACRSAALFWRDNQLNELADKDDLRAVTKRVNGGYNGLSDREKYLKRFKAALGV